MKEASIEAVFTASPSQVFEAITNNSDYSWRSDLSRIDVLGKNTFTEVSKNGFTTNFTITQKIPEKLYAFTLDNNRFSGAWKGTFEETPQGGTRFIMEEELNIKNPIIRLIASAFMNLNKMQEQYIADLKKKLGE